jgi:hypothetical protein
MCKVNKIQYKNSQVGRCKDILDESNFEDWQDDVKNEVSKSKKTTSPL